MIEDIQLSLIPTRLHYVPATNQPDAQRVSSTVAAVELTTSLQPLSHNGIVLFTNNEIFLSYTVYVMYRFGVDKTYVRLRRKLVGEFCADADTPTPPTATTTRSEDGNGRRPTNRAERACCRSTDAPSTGRVRDGWGQTEGERSLSIAPR